LRGDMKDEQSFVPNSNNFARLSSNKATKWGKYMHDVMHVDNKADFVLE
jgi:methylenetetrahydrofolate reductase (NADPH)